MTNTGSPIILRTSLSRSIIREEDALSLAQSKYLGETKMTQKTENAAVYATLKGKVQSLDDGVRNMVNQVIYVHREEIRAMREENKELEELLNNTIAEVKKNLGKQLMNAEDELKTHTAHQKAENSRLQQQIIQLKGETVGLKFQMNGMAKRVGKLEMNVGNEEPQEEITKQI